jgi:ribosomal protein S13
LGLETSRAISRRTGADDETAIKPLTEEEIKAFAIAWYDALDIHAPVEECYRMLADNDQEA